MEIRQAMAYVIALVGIPADKIPMGVTNEMMVSYIKEKWATSDLSEMKTAFEWAVETQAKDVNGNSITNLFGKPLNIEYLKSVIVAHREQNRLKSKPIDGMTNHQRVGSLFSILQKQQPELYEKLKKIGEEKPKEEVKPVVISNDPFQRWMRQFDNLKRKYQYEQRFIKIGEVIFNVDSFLEKKLKTYTDKKTFEKVFSIYGETHEITKRQGTKVKLKN